MDIEAKGAACDTGHTGFDLQDTSSPSEPISLTGRITREQHFGPFTTA